MRALVSTLREIAEEQRSCAAACIHAPKTKALYQSRAENIEDAIKAVESAVAACRSIRSALEAADRLTREALGEKGGDK